jgi:cation:H+ antiporter
VIGIIFTEKVSFLRLRYVNLPSFALVVVYIAIVWRLTKQRRDTPPDSSLLQYEHSSNKFTWSKLAISALTIIGAAIWLSYIGEYISITTGWGATFVGSLFLAITTSLPEVKVAVASVRLGAIDLAIGDILGANLLDLTCIFFLGLFNDTESFFANASSSHLITLSLLLVMNMIITFAFKTPTKRKFFKFASWYSPLLLTLYIIGTYILYIFS